MLHKIPKVLIYFFLIVFILQLAGLILLLILPQPSQAVDFRPQVGIDDTFRKGEGKPVTGKTIGEYIRSIYKYAIGIVGILAAVVMMFGGVLWIMSGGNAERASNAKAWIGASLTGLILTLFSYMILKTVNPALVEFQPLYVTPVEKQEEKGCCAYYEDGNPKAQYMTKNECTSLGKGSEHHIVYIDFDYDKTVKDGKTCVSTEPTGPVGCCKYYDFQGPGAQVDFCDDITENECKNKNYYVDWLGPDYKCNVQKCEKK